MDDLRQILWFFTTAGGCFISAGNVVAKLPSLHDWLERAQLTGDDIIAPYVEAMEQVLAQDTEQDAEGRIRIIQGVAEDRRVSIEDPQMRHGRKTKSKRFNGYKQHIATDLDPTLILACAVTPANRPEEEPHRNFKPTCNIRAPQSPSFTSTADISTARS